MATYNPQDHIVSNKGFGVLAKPVDARSWWTDGIEQRPFASKAEVLAYFPTADSRKGNFLVYIGSEAYTFRGPADADLIPFITQDVDAGPVEGSNKPIASNYIWQLEQNMGNTGGLHVAGGKLYAGETEVQLHLDYFAGVWEKGPYQAGWLVVSTDRTKVWKARQNHTSNAEPQAGVNWELLFEVPKVDAQPTEDSANAIASGYVQQLIAKLAYFQNNQLRDAEGKAIALSVSMDSQPVKDSKKAVESGYFFTLNRTLPRYDQQTKVWRDWQGNVILKIDPQPAINSPYPVASGYLYTLMQSQVYYRNGRFENLSGEEIFPNLPEDDTPPYVHPDTHPASMIEQDGQHRFVTDTQINRWNDTYTAATIENKLSGLAGGLIWKNPVTTFAELATTYPSAANNWTSRVTTEGRVYRYDAATSQWVYIFDQLDPLATPSLDGNMSKEDKAKLDGIAPGATKNATDAQLRNRSTHTGTQSIATISGLQTALDDKLDASDIATDVEDPAQAGRLVTVAQLNAIDTGPEVPENVLTADDIATDIEDPTQADKLVTVGMLEGLEPGTGYTQATLEAASDGLNFLNPLGHIRNEALTGTQTFTRTGTSLGTTVVQSYTSTGSGALTFDFTHSILNSDFVSGQALEAGDYRLFFSNWGDVVAVSIAKVGSGIDPEPEPENQPPTITLLGPNPMILTVGDTYTEPGATASDDEDGDLTSAIAITGTVNTATAGTYTRHYNVQDSKGLAALEIVRTVQVNGSPEPDEDTTPPSAPGKPVFSNRTTTTATANWTPATDNVAIAGYNLYIDGVKQN